MDLDYMTTLRLNALQLALDEKAKTPSYYNQTPFGNMQHYVPAPAFDVIAKAKEYLEFLKGLDTPSPTC